MICAGAAAPRASGAAVLSTAGTDPVNGAVVWGIPTVLLEIGTVEDGTVEGRVEGIVEPAGAVGGKLPGLPEPVGGNPGGPEPVGGRPGGACRPSCRLF